MNNEIVNRVKLNYLSTVNDRIFLESIKELLTNINLYVNASQISSLINKENGIEKTMLEIERKLY